MIFVILANMGYIYVATTKAYVEQTAPKAAEKDTWTENKALWTSELLEVNISENYDDYINGTVYGNRSIQFSIVNSSRISMQLENVEPVNCSEPDGFKSLFMRVKQTIPETKPKNVTLYLFSASTSNYFYYNLTQSFSDSIVNHWNNLTVTLKSDGWSRNSPAANWETITGLKLEFSWPGDSNITLRVEGLFFRGIFKTLMESVGTDYFLAYPVYVFTQFVFNWFILGTLVFIMSRGLGAKASWKTVSILAGFTLVALLVQTLINAAAYATLPSLYYRLELVSGVKGESDIAYDELMKIAWPVPDIVSYAQIATRIWNVILCIFAVRFSTDMSWGKSILVAAVAYMITTLVVGMLLSLFMLGF
jgi:hypothetical protein